MRPRGTIEVPRDEPNHDDPVKAVFGNIEGVPNGQCGADAHQIKC